MAEKITPQISIVICTFNRAESLKNCLQSLTKQTFSDFEVIIVDGGSQDKTPQIIENYKNKLNIKVVINKSKNIAKLRDCGWRQAEGRYISWIDDDVVASPNWAETVFNVLKNNKNITGVTGPTLIPKEILQNRDVFFFHNKKDLLAKFWQNFVLEGKEKDPGQILKNGFWTPGSNFSESTKLEKSVEVDFLEACNMTFKKSLVEKVNGFNPDFFKEWSEADLSQRIKKLGYKLLFHPKAVVEHHISKKGAFHGRTTAKERMQDFFNFYFKHAYKFKYLWRFLILVFIQNLYYTYKAIKDKNISWLGSWLGTIKGFKYICKKN